MSTRVIRTLVLSLVAVALPAGAGAVDLSGRIGVGYSRLELTPPDGPGTTSPHLDLDLGLDARGFVVQPEIFDWKLVSSYRRISDSVDGSRTNLQKSFLYDASAAVFRSPSSAMTALLGASRTQSDFSTNLALDAFGQSVTDLARASVVVRQASLPPVTASYFYRNLDETIPGLPLHNRTTHGLDASVAGGTSAYHLSASYAGELNDGTWTTDQYNLHNVAVQAGAPLRDGLDLAIDDRYYRLEPKSTAVGAVAQDNNAFRAYMRDRGTFGDHHVLEYLYGHAITETPGSPLAEITRNSVRYEGDHLLTSPTLFTRWSLDLSLNQTRLGTTESSSSGETGGVQLWWRRVGDDRLYEVYGGPLVGFTQSDVATKALGYGGSATGRLSQPWAEQIARLSYESTYGTDLYGIPGWSLRHSLTGSVEGHLWTGTYSALLRGNALRSYSPVLGDGANRSIEAYAKSTFRRFELELRGLMESGMTGATPGEFVGDGLFIPAPFDTSSRQLWLRGTLGILPGLNARAHFRLTSNTRPGQPSIDESEVIGALEYQFAALYVSVEDRIDWFDQTGGRATSNTIFVRLYRRFNARF